jgi:hypothetical protein
MFRERADRAEREVQQCCADALRQLVDAARLRPVSKAELDTVGQLFEQRLNESRRQLKLACFHAIAGLYRTYSAKPKPRRALDKNATELLNSWFFSHINDPVRRWRPPTPHRRSRETR